MNTIEKRLSENELDLLKSIIGKTMTSYSHEEFVYTDTVSDVVKFNFDKKQYFLYCFLNNINYFGSQEDVSFLSIETIDYPFLQTKKLLKTVVNKQIKNIIIVNDNNQLFNNGIQTYDLWFTKGVIFDFGDFQIAFEKLSWMLEEIRVLRGYDLIDKFVPITDFENQSWEDGVIPKSNRELIYLK